VITEKLNEVFDLLGIDPDNISNDMLLEDDIGMDSQEIIELHCAIEKVMGIKLPAQFVKRSMTVGTLIENLNNIGEVN
jgi:acyl carrier protein